jgi:hypothetical protein
MDTKARLFTPISALSLDELVPAEYYSDSYTAATVSRSPFVAVPESI